MTEHDPSFVLTLKQPPKLLSIHFCLQYLENVVAYQRDSIPYQQHNWSFNLGFTICNGSLILEQTFPFHNVQYM